MLVAACLLGAVTLAGCADADIACSDLCELRDQHGTACWERASCETYCEVEVAPRSDAQEGLLAAFAECVDVDPLCHVSIDDCLAAKGF